MFLSTQGILLRKTKLTGNGFILKIYTLEYGVKSFFIRKGKKDKITLQPLIILNITSYFKEEKEVNHIKEVSLNNVYTSIYSDIIKSNIIIFLNEVLDKLLREEQPNHKLYHYITSNLIAFDQTELDINFHLVFLTRLSSYLGITIETSHEAKFFDIENGKFINDKPKHSNFIEEKKSKIFSAFLQQIDQNKIVINNYERRLLIEILIQYYQYHFGIKNLKSLPILEVLFD